MIKKVRVMWLINHTSAREFELLILKKIGIDEIFLPKITPDSHQFCSASIDYSEDENLSISKEELNILNNTDWYTSPSFEAWEIANKYFELLFFIPVSKEAFHSIVRNFRGAIILRAYGLSQSLSYSSILSCFFDPTIETILRQIGHRFYFGQAYPHLYKIENDYLIRRKLDLPLGFICTDVNNLWTGENKKIKDSQSALLETFKVQNCIESWRNSISKVTQSLHRSAKHFAKRKQEMKKKRVAVILPIGYLGGSLRAAISLANAFYRGSVLAQNEIELVFGYLIGSETIYTKEDFEELDPNIVCRPYRWCVLDDEQAKHTMAYAGLTLDITASTYQVPDDDINNFLDCDLWVIVSDRLEHQLLPLKTNIFVIYDYIQRREDIMSETINNIFINAVKNAKKIFVTTNFTLDDVIQFAGVEKNKIKKLPILVSDFFAKKINKSSKKRNKYFIWTTNTGKHKNHIKAFRALRLYYEKYDGELMCYVTGVNTDKMLTQEFYAKKELENELSKSDILKEKMRFLGNLDDYLYTEILVNSQFLWHPGRIDNGNLSVVEAAQCGVPSLSSKYPAMVEFDEEFKLNLTWLDTDEPDSMAIQLKDMELQACYKRTFLPSDDVFDKQAFEKIYHVCWQALQECL